MTIKVKLLPSGKWAIYARERGGQPATRSNPTSAYRFVETRLKRLLVQVETAVLVDYGQSLTNETVTTQNYPQIMYAFTCFFEDYLKSDFLKQRAEHYLALLDSDLCVSVKSSPGLTCSKKMAETRCGHD